MKRKALVLDIDGTLTNSRKDITLATKTAIQAIMEKGHLCVLASGRPAPGMRRYERELELEKYGGYLLSQNGARILSRRTGEPIYQKALPLEIVPGLYEFALENGCGLATHKGDMVISAFAPDRYVSLEARINGMPMRQVERFPDFVDFDIYKCFMTADDRKAAVLERKLQKLYGEQAAIYRSEPFFIEIVPKGVDKGDSLRRLTEHTGIPREDVVCCGDGFNDISMLQYAGVGIAMGNAQQEVKDAADYVTATNDEDGIVEAIARFFHAPGDLADADAQ